MLSSDFSIPSSTVTASGMSALICFGGMIVYLIMMYHRVTFRQILIGLVINVVMVLFLESSLHTIFLVDGSAVSDSVIFYMLYLAVVSALIEELSRYVVFRYSLGKTYSSADAAIGFALGFCLTEVIMGGISNVSAYSLASYVNTNGLETMLEEAAEEADDLVEQLQAIYDAGAMNYILSGFNRVFYVAREAALSVITWYAATRSDQIRLLPAAIGLHILVRLPDCFYQAGGEIPLLAEELLSYAMTVGLCALAIYIYKKLEEPVFHFKIESLRPKRHR